jgi:biotin carboxyl carrier protein
MYQIKINGQEGKEIALEDNQVKISGENKDWDVVELPDGRLNVLLENKSYNIYLDNIDRQKKQIRLRVNQHLYDLEIQESIDLLLKKMGLNLNTAKKAESINAPMPGLVLSILVEEGQSLKKGEPVLILEAMKMENVFKAPEDAVVKSIKIKTGQAVEKGVVLIELS